MDPGIDPPGTLKVPPLAMDSSWKLHYDDNHRQHYWHNVQTGESKWDVAATNNGSSAASWQTFDPNETSGGEGDAAATAAALARVKERATTYTAYIAAQQSNQDYSDCEDGEEGDESGSIEYVGAAPTRLNNTADGPPPQRKKSKRGKAKVRGGDDDDTTALLEGKEKKLPTQQTLVYATTKLDICCYSFWIFLNAALLEGPLAAAEGCVRASVFFAAGTLVLLPAMALRQADLVAFARLLLKEGLLSLAAAISLAVPCMACAAYRRYRMDVDWPLAPLPSMLGWVDSRRFAVLTYGNGSFACNVRHDHVLQRGGARAAEGDGAGGPVFTDVHGAGDPEEPPANKKKKRKQAELARARVARARGAEGWPCEDTWPGAILLEPRRAHIDLVLIVRGDDPFHTLS